MKSQRTEKRNLEITYLSQLYRAPFLGGNWIIDMVISDRYKGFQRWYTGLGTQTEYPN